MAKGMSSRVLQVQPSVTLAITAKAAELKAAGKDVVGFGAGEPDFPTVDYIVEAAKKALDAGDTKYTGKRGKELINNIVNKLKKDNGLDYEPSQVSINIGAKQSCYNVCQAVVDSGDEVIIIAPYWVSYPEMVRLAGGTPVVVNTSSKTGYKTSPEQLKAALTDKTRLIIFNSPSNPTGATYTPEEIEAIAGALSGHGCWILSDEIYEKIIYDGTKFKSIASVSDEMYRRTITVNGHSKAYAMTGWRLGYMAGPREVIAACKKVQSHSTSNPASFVQAAGAEALAGDQSYLAERLDEFDRRRKYVVNRLNAMPGVKCSLPGGAFYVFPDVSGNYGRTLGGIEVKDSLSFCDALLNNKQVAVVPGVAFGNDNGVRISYATSMEQIEKGMDRLEEFLK